MDRELYERVGAWMDGHKEVMVEDIKRLVRIDSVSRPGTDGTPFGKGCLRALEEMLAIGREHGFHCENYGDIVGSIGEKEKDWENLIGFWNHLDVVPTGNGWENGPFEPVVKDRFLIGRGVQDNKGPAVGILYVMQCLKELQIPLKHELCLFVGTDEERGMEDMEYYTAHYPAPKLSMTPDSGFPVCYGEKGILEGQMVTKDRVSAQVLEAKGGNASNMIPDRAWVLLADSQAVREELGRLCGGGSSVPGEGAAWGLGEDTASEAADGKARAGDSCAAGEKAGEENIGEENVGGEKGNAAAEENGGRGSGALEEIGISDRISYKAESDGIRITAYGTSKHSAAPHGSVNAIHELCVFLENMTSLSAKDRQLFAGIGKLTREYDGEETGIAYRDEVSGQTTCAGTVLTMEEGHLSLTLNIRYAITAKDQENIETLGAYGASNGLDWRLERNSRPGYFPKEHPAVEVLTRVYNELTGSDSESYVMGGGTYARKLPNAFSYGPGGMKESEEDKEARARLFAPGHGGGHEPDEALNLRLFLEAMKIYTCAIVALNDVEL